MIGISIVLHLWRCFSLCLSLPTTLILVTPRIQSPVTLGHLLFPMNTYFRSPRVVPFVRQILGPLIGIFPPPPMLYHEVAFPLHEALVPPFSFPILSSYCQSSVPPPPWTSPCPDCLVLPLLRMHFKSFWDCSFFCMPSTPPFQICLHTSLPPLLSIPPTPSRTPPALLATPRRQSSPNVYASLRRPIPPLPPPVIFLLLRYFTQCPLDSLLVP